MDFDSLVITFLVFSFIGYLSEVVYCSVGQRHLVNRGFLYGPYLPIYGFGGLVVKICLVPLAKYPVLVFFMGMILTSIVEYIGSWGLEKLFDIKLWDYSKKFLNINGRVCLLNSTLFGIMGLVCLYFAEPRLNSYIAMIPAAAEHYIAEFIILVLAIDTTLSVVKMNAFKNALREAREKAKANEERIKALIADGKNELANELKMKLEEEREKNKERIRKASGHIIKSFPSATAKSDEIRAQLDRLRSSVEKAKVEIKAEAEKLHDKREARKNDSV